MTNARRATFGRAHIIKSFDDKGLQQLTKEKKKKKKKDLTHRGSEQFEAHDGGDLVGKPA